MDMLRTCWGDVLKLPRSAGVGMGASVAGGLQAASNAAQRTVTKRAACAIITLTAVVR